MHVSTSASASASPATPPVTRLRWRVVDIVVASVIGVASGLIFLLWNIAYRGPSALLEPLLPGLQGLLDGPWLFAGVLGALIIRKPGAAIYTEVVAAAVSALAHRQHVGRLPHARGGARPGPRRRARLPRCSSTARWSLPVAILAGVGAALAGGINNLVLWYAGADLAFIVVYLVSTVDLGCASSPAPCRGCSRAGSPRPGRSTASPRGAKPARASSGDRRRAVAPPPSRRAAGAGGTPVAARVGGAGRLVPHRAGRAGAAARRVRVGQVDAAARPRRRARRRRRGRADGRAAASTACRPRAARGRAGLVLQDPDAQVILARVGDDVAFGCENLGVPRDGDLAARAARRSTPSGSTCRSTARPRRCPAGRSSGSRSPGCSRCDRASCCSTSPPRTSTRRASPRCATPVGRAARRAPARRSSSSSIASSVWLPLVTA